MLVKDISNQILMLVKDIFNQILKTNFLDELTGKGNHKGFFTEAMNVGRNIAQPPYKREVGGGFFGV